MLAHGQGGLLNASKLAAGLGVSAQTVTRHIDLLCDLLLVRRLPPCRANRERILAAIGEAGLAEPYVNVIVSGGRVQLWGLVSSEAEKDALRVAAETVPGVTGVENNVAVASPPHLRAGWA